MINGNLSAMIMAYQSEKDGAILPVRYLFAVSRKKIVLFMLYHQFLN